MIRTEELLLNVGPQHPSTHGVFRIVVKLDGEVITEATPSWDICTGARRSWRKA